MKWLTLVLCLVVALATADTAFARGGKVFGGGKGILKGGILRNRDSGGGRSSESQNAPVDKAPTYEVEHKLLNAINNIRKQYGLKELILDRDLLLRTRRHCGWMANARRMVHSTDPCAENIAMGQPDVENVMGAWMRSSGHRANILNAGYTKVGLSGYTNEQGSPFWCQQFE
jgi:uncharacterized protein YkwD